MDIQVEIIKVEGVNQYFIEDHNVSKEIYHFIIKLNKESYKHRKALEEIVEEGPYGMGYTTAKEALDN